MSNYCKECYKKQEEIEQLKKSIDRIMQNKEIKTIDLDIAKENERLKEESKNYCIQLQVLAQALEEIRDYILSLNYESKDSKKVLDIAIEVIGAEE